MDAVDGLPHVVSPHLGLSSQEVADLLAGNLSSLWLLGKAGAACDRLAAAVSAGQSEADASFVQLETETQVLKAQLTLVTSQRDEISRVLNDLRKLLVLACDPGALSSVFSHALCLLLYWVPLCRFAFGSRGGSDGRKGRHGSEFFVVVAWRRFSTLRSRCSSIIGDKIV
jgi:hypothetical protein